MSPPRQKGAKAQTTSPPPAHVLKQQKADEESLVRQLFPDSDPELLPHAEVPPQAAAPDFWNRMSMMMDPKFDRQVVKLTSRSNDFELKMQEDMHQRKAAPDKAQK